jgi:hypothetical protein
VYGELAGLWTGKRPKSLSVDIRENLPALQHAAHITAGCLTPFNWCHLTLEFDLENFIQISSHLIVPDTQKCFFISRRRIRLPYGPSNFGGFGIRPGNSPFNAAIRTFCTSGARLRPKPSRTRLATNLPIPGPLHYFIDFHFPSSFLYSRE